MPQPSATIQPVLVLGAYLKEQAALQQRLPRDQRRAVPTYAALAEGAGVTQQSVFRLANQAYLTQLPLKLAYRVMRVLRERGFEVGVGDVVAWQLPGGLVRPEDRAWQSRVEMHERDRLATTLGAYLEHLRRVEAQRPEELRRPVPDKEELAEAAAISRRQVERLLADHVLRLDLPKLGAILSLLVRYGWAATPEDVLLYPEESREL